MELNHEVISFLLHGRRATPDAELTVVGDYFVFICDCAYALFVVLNANFLICLLLIKTNAFVGKKN